MIIKSAEINKFKSINTENNMVFFDKTVTALIGKNESGKSNILESIGLIKNLFLPLGTEYLNNKTRGQSDNPSITLTLSFTTFDKEKFPSAEGDTVLSYSATQVTMEGGLSSLISNDDNLNTHIEKVLSVVSSNELGLASSHFSSLKNQTAKLHTISQKLYSTILTDLQSAKNTINTSPLDSKKEYMESIDIIKKSISNYYNLIPQLHYRKSDNELKNSYPYTDIKKLYEETKDLSVSNNSFINLMLAAGVEKDTLFGAFEGGTEAAKRTFWNKVVKKINALVDEFNEKFYQQEKIAIDFVLEGSTVKIFILTDDMYMNFSERSNGLKWYFSLFIETKAKATFERPILYLLDEPGVYLHVRAQKKVLELFEHLCETGNQVIYTTHSPFMINPNNVYNVRAVEKNENGFTNIYTSVYYYKINKKHRLETLSPLITALGMDLQDNIGPQYEKTNVVVEGITDSMYLTAMMNYFKVNDVDRPSIIPCAGVGNVNRVVSILIGWGCNFKAVLDYDEEGYNEYKRIVKDTNLTDDNNVYFVNLKTATDVNVVKKNRATIETLISSEDNDKLSTKYDGTDETKTLAAKEFMDRVSNGDIIPSKETCENFKILFVALGINIK